MRAPLIAYIVTAIIFFGMDFLWLSLSSNSIYKPRLQGLLLEKPDLTVAAVFYLLYLIGVVIFAVLPALQQGDWKRALWAGALLGLVSYGAYDLTNLATLKGWSTSVSIIDMVWGTFVTGFAATLGYFITRMV